MIERGHEDIPLLYCTEVLNPDYLSTFDHFRDTTERDGPDIEAMIRYLGVPRLIDLIELLDYTGRAPRPEDFGNNYTRWGRAMAVWQLHHPNDSVLADLAN